MAPDVTSGSPPMIGRMLSIAEWQTYVAGYQFDAMTPTLAVLHHTWRPSIQQWQGLASMRGMQKFYAGKGWGSAPHIYVGPDGIWLFTPMKDIGIHAGNGNGSRRQGWYSIGIEMVGDYDLARPTGAVWEATKAVLGGLSRRLNIPIEKLLAFHRDYSPKSCPGWAVTKEWVIGEVNAWLKGAAPPTPPPQGKVGTPTPQVDELFELLMDQSYARRGEGFNHEWAFHQFAIKNQLGFPMGKSARFAHGGKDYSFQAFARDTLFCEIPNWGDVQRLSELLSGSIPPDGSLGRALLDQTFKAVGATFQPGWAFHQYAVAGRTLGPPLAESKTVAVDGVTYSYQVFATDTIYNPGTDWSNIQRLSALANATDPRQQRLRDALLAETYKVAGQTYRADWAFHQLARTNALGAPLGQTNPVSAGSLQYNFQVYALDTLYNQVPNWSDVKRLSQLTAPTPATLSTRAPATLSAERVVAPELPPYRIVEYRIPGMQPTAYTGRGKTKIEAIILHGDAGPAAVQLAAMGVPGAKRMTHYYVALDGTIYRLLEDHLAASHAGMAQWQGQRRNTNNLSIGITIERAPGRHDTQFAALGWLISTLRTTHRLPPTALLRWSDLSPKASGDLADLDLARLTTVGA